MQLRIIRRKKGRPESDLCTPQLLPKTHHIVRLTTRRGGFEITERDDGCLLIRCDAGPCTAICGSGGTMAIKPER